MHAANLLGIPCSRGEKEHDVVVGEGGSWDAPNFRLGSSYGGAGRNQHGRQPASKLYDFYRRRSSRHRRLLSGLPRQEFALQRYSGNPRRPANADTERRECILLLLKEIIAIFRIHPMHARVSGALRIFYFLFSPRIATVVSENT